MLGVISHGFTAHATKPLCGCVTARHRRRAWLGLAALSTGFADACFPGKKKDGRGSWGKATSKYGATWSAAIESASVPQETARPPARAGPGGRAPPAEVPARKRVESDFTIRLQLQLVTVEYLESLHVFLTIIHSATPILGGNGIYSEVFLGEIGDKPVNDS